MNIFPGPNFVSPERRCPLNRGVPKERFHCSLNGHAQKLLPISSSFSHRGVAAYDQKFFLLPFTRKKCAGTDYE